MRRVRRGREGRDGLFTWRRGGIEPAEVGGNNPLLVSCDHCRAPIRRHCTDHRGRPKSTFCASRVTKANPAPASDPDPDPERTDDP